MIKTLIIATAMAITTQTADAASEKTIIGKTDAKSLNTKVMTPEALWAMGRIAASAPSPDGKYVVYQVGYYSVKENRSHHVLYTIKYDGSENKLLTATADNETDPVWIENGKRIAFISNASGSAQVWTMAPDGTDRKQMTNDKLDIAGFKVSPDGKRVILIRNCHTTISYSRNTTTCQRLQDVSSPTSTTGTGTTT